MPKVNPWSRKIISVVVVLLAGLLPSGGALAGTAGPAAQARTVLERGDTLGALRILNQALKRNKKDSETLLARAGLYFARGEGQKAMIDYRNATGLEADSLRLRAWLGLSRTWRTLLGNNYRAELACRKGLNLAPDSPELLLEKAQVQLAYGGAEGHRLASEALIRLLRLDPACPGAYRLWRTECPSPDFGQLRQVREFLEPWLAEHPDSSGWWLDLAWDSFLEGETAEAEAILSRLEAAHPNWDSPDHQLLLARCSVEREDSAAFMQHYNRALDLVVEQDCETRAFLETEVVLTRQAAPRWAECHTNRDKAAFLRSYWLDLDADPLEPLNHRLIEHYNRLNFAQRYLHLRNPQSRFNTSETLNRLIGQQSLTYYYDSEPLRKQTALLGLDPRGVVWVRMGPPDKRERHWDEGEIGQQSLISQAPPIEVLKRRPGRVIGEGVISGYDTKKLPSETMRNVRYSDSAVLGANSEFWYYGPALLLFVDDMNAGEFVYVPHKSNIPRLDMLKVTGAERYAEPGVYYTLEYYMAQFLAANSLDNEVEFYQDDWIPRGVTPVADMAVYDSLWGLVQRTRGEVFEVRREKDRSLWLARHRATMFPGKYHYTVRMASEDEKWLGKGEMEFVAFEPDSLNLSAVVLGSPPAADTVSCPERGGERFVPRPSTKFGRGEPVSVYFEVYNLLPDSAGQRSYREWIDVVRLEKGESRIKKYAGKVFQLLSFNFSDPASSLTHTFERQARWLGDRAPECFTLDTAGLESGSYRLVIQVRDNVSGHWDTEEVFFDLERSTEAALNQ